MRGMFALAMAMVLSGSAAEAAPMGSKFKVGSWSGGAYSDDSARRFSHCAISAPYDHGVALVFMVNRDYQWAVAFGSSRFNLRVGQNHRLMISLDNGDAHEVQAYGIRRDLGRVNLAPNGELFKKFMRAGTMRLTANDDVYDFTLQDTARALPELLKCVRERLNPTPLQAQGAAQSRTASIAGDSQVDLRAEVTSLAANLLSEAGVRGFRFDPPSQGRSKSDVSWTAPGMSGALLVLLDPAIKRPSDATPRLIALAAERCKGKFASGAMPEESGAARVFSSCQTGTAEPTMGFYLTIPRAAGGHYVLLTFPQTASASLAPASPQEPDKDVRAAAYRVLK